MSELQMSKLVGSGQHSHLVPMRDGAVVGMRDGNHSGTDLFWSQMHGCYVAVSYDAGECSFHDRLVLVRGVDVTACEEEDLLVACDLESHDGLAFLSYPKDSTVEASDLVAAEGCEIAILWDSADE